LEASETMLTHTPRTRPASAASQAPVRRPLPAHLPREEIVHTPSCICPECGGELRKLGEDVSEVLERVPAQFKVVRHVRVKLSCARCQSIVQAPAPARPIERGSRGLGCSPTCSCPSTVITYRCIVRRRSMRAKAWSL